MPGSKQSARVVGFSMPVGLPDLAEVRAILVTFHGIAGVAQCLDVAQVIGSPRFRGTMWSTSSAFSSAEMPQSSQRNLALFRTS